MDLLSTIEPPLERGSPRERLAHRLFRHSCIDERRSCIPDFADRRAAVLYGSSRPTLEQRMAVYRREAPALAAAACERALKQARVAPQEISHLVVVSSTGVSIPGPDVELAARLSLRADVERTLVAFMGCSGAFHGLRTARHAAADARDARVLLACVELCSIHRRDAADAAALVPQAIFADGAAAAVLGRVEADGAHLLELGRSATRLEPGTRGALTWEIREGGFAMYLSPELPAILERSVPAFAASLLEGAESPPELAWVVHPGGAAILRAVERALALQPEALASGWSVLRRLGNTSSAAVLYVLEEALARGGACGDGIALGFGPGLTLEAFRFRRGRRNPGPGGP